MIAPSTTAQAAHNTRLCAIYLLPPALRNTFLMFHLLNSKLVSSPGALADTGALCFSLDAEVLRVRWLSQVRETGEGALLCSFIVRVYFLADLGFAPQCVRFSAGRCPGASARRSQPPARRRRTPRILPGPGKQLPLSSAPRPLPALLCRSPCPVLGGNVSPRHAGACRIPGPFQVPLQKKPVLGLCFHLKSPWNPPAPSFFTPA